MVPSREADAIVDSLEPLAELLSEELLIPVEHFVSTNYTGLVEPSVPAVSTSACSARPPVQAMDARRRGHPRQTRQGSTSYRAQFNVRCDSGIESFEDLRGRTIAFVDAASASGYQFPTSRSQERARHRPETDMTYIFAGSHDASALAVTTVTSTFRHLRRLTRPDGRETIEGDFPTSRK